MSKKKEETKYELDPPISREEACKEVLEECKEFLSTNLKDEGISRKPYHLLYLIRITIPDHEQAYYKIGYTSIYSKTRTRKERTFADRIREINTEYGTNIGYGEPNIIVVALAKVVGKPEELFMHDEMSLKTQLEEKHYKLKVKNRKGTGYWKELYAIDTKVYDTFISKCKENKNKLWESELYVLDDDNYESWKGDPL
jgi:hypothetical protein